MVDSGPGVYIASLTGNQVNRGNTWDAEVTVQVVDTDGEPLTGVVVEGVWDEGDGGESSCSTDKNGACRFETADILKNIKSATFEVEALSYESLPYLFELDDGWDAEEDATFISIRKS
jgi:hypothetical protein